MNDPFIVDVHTHLGFTPEFTARLGSVEDFVRLMDATGTRVSVFVPMGPLSAQFESGYAETLRALEQYPDRLRAYTVFDPNWPEESLRWMERYQDAPGFAGVKIHPARHEAAPEDPRYRDLWAFAEARRLVVLTHSWSYDPAKPAQNLSVPERFGPILAAHPNLKLILGHCGGRPSGARQAVALMKQYPNCWADLSGDYFQPGRIEGMCGEGVGGRLLYATDANWIEPRLLLGHVLKARVSAGERMRILRDNARDLFGDALP